MKDFDEFRFIKEYKALIDYISKCYYPLYYYVDTDSSIVIDCKKTKNTKEWEVNLESRKKDIIKEIINNNIGLEYLDNKIFYSTDKKYIINLEEKTIIGVE